MKCEVIGIGFDGEIRIMKEYNLKEVLKCRGLPCGRSVRRNE